MGLMNYFALIGLEQMFYIRVGFAPPLLIPPLTEPENSN